MIDLFDEHIARLRRDVGDAKNAVAGLAPYLATDAPRAAEVEALLLLPSRIPAFLRGLEEIIRSTEDDRVRGFAGGIFAYVFNPVDIIGADELGYLGYVEDAVICWRALDLLREEFGASPSPAAGLEPTDAANVQTVWNVLSDEIREAVDLFLEQFDAVLKGVQF